MADQRDQPQPGPKDRTRASRVDGTPAGPNDPEIPPEADELSPDGSQPDPRKLNGENAGLATGRKSEDDLLKRPRQDGWNSNT